MKIIAFMVITLFTQVAFAKTVARVLDISGNAFMFSKQGQAKTLSYSAKVPDFSEVMVEDGGKLVLLTSQGHKVYIVGGTLLQMYHGIVEVKNGSVWVKSKEDQGPGIVQTSNTLARYGQGEFVFSFDNESGKSQVLVLNGNVSFANSIEPDLGVDVRAGTFSMLENDKNDGLPRYPTKIGKTSYTAVKTRFAGFRYLKQNDWDHIFEEKKTVVKSSRSIASVDDQFSPAKKKGKVTFIRTYKNPSRVPASVPDSLDYYKDKITELEKVKKPLKTHKKATIRVFGKTSSPKKEVLVKKQRMPASNPGQSSDTELDMLLKDLNNY